MATRGPLGKGKRERERARDERRKQKTARRSEAKLRRDQSGPRQDGVDPDIAGIVPGPQANPWLDDLETDEDDKPDEQDQK
jgi:hypothetical protein